MAGITLAQAGEAIVYPAVPWSKRLFSLKVRSFPKGSVPRHLIGFLFKKGGVPATCAKETMGKAGAARVHAMNACVSAALRRK
ncbi:hypothetical protein ES705_25508 [subsurface metagenome]